MPRPDCVTSERLTAMVWPLSIPTCKLRLAVEPSSKLTPLKLVSLATRAISSFRAVNSELITARSSVFSVPLEA